MQDREQLINKFQVLFDPLGIPSSPATQVEILFDSELTKKASVFGHVDDSGSSAMFRWQPVYALAGKFDKALLGLVLYQTGNSLEQSSLARAVRPENCKDLFFFYLQTQAMERIYSVKIECLYILDL